MCIFLFVFLTFSVVGIWRSVSTVKIQAVPIRPVASMEPIYKKALSKELGKPRPEPISKETDGRVGILRYRKSCVTLDVALRGHFFPGGYVRGFKVCA